MARKNKNAQWRGRRAEFRRKGQGRKDKRFENFINEHNAGVTEKREGDAACHDNSGNQSDESHLPDDE